MIKQCGNILVVQAYNVAYKDIAQIAYTNKYNYCKLHGYDFVSYEREWNDFRDSTWLIPTTIHQLLHSNIDYEWIYWTDVDSLIMNYSITLEQFTSQANADHHIIASLWRYKSKYTYINLNADIDILPCESIWFLIHTGNFFVRNSEWSIRFFDRLCRDVRFMRPELKNVIGGDEFGLTVYYTNEPNIRNRFLLLSAKEFISFDYTTQEYDKYGKESFVKQFNIGDFIIHFPRRPLTTRYLLMDKFKSFTVK